MAHGALWSLFGSIVAQGAGMVGTIISARILGKEAFGELGMIRSTVLMFGVVAGTGLGMAATKYVAEFRIKDRAKAGRMIGLLINAAIALGGTVTVIFLIVAEPIATYVLKVPHLLFALQVGCFLLVLNTINGVQLGVICGFEAFRTQSKIIALDGVLNVMLIPIGAYEYGVVGAIGGSVVAALISYFIKQRIMIQECNRAFITIIRRNFDSDIQVLWNFVLPAVLVGVSLQPFEWLSRLILANGKNGYGELGLFTAAYTWSQAILFFPGQLSGPTQPFLANLVGEKKLGQIKTILLQGNFSVGIIAFLTCAFCILFSNLIMSTYGSGYGEASATLSILCISSFFCALTQIFKNFLYALNKVWVVVASQFLMGIILCIFSFTLNNYGANGVAFSYMVSWISLFLMEAFLSLIFLKKLKGTI